MRSQGCGPRRHLQYANKAQLPLVRTVQGPVPAPTLNESRAARPLVDLSVEGKKAANDGAKTENDKAATDTRGGPQAPGPREGLIRRPQQSLFVRCPTRASPLWHLTIRGEIAHNSVMRLEASWRRFSSYPATSQFKPRSATPAASSEPKRLSMIAQELSQRPEAFVRPAHGLPTDRTQLGWGNPRPNLRTGKSEFGPRRREPELIHKNVQRGEGRPPHFLRRK